MTAIRFPSRSKYATSSAFFDAVYRWLTRLTGAELYRYYKTGEVLPSEETLIDWLGDVSWPKIRDFVADYQSSGSPGLISGDTYQGQLERAVTFCLETYDPERIHARAVRGGQRSKPSRRFTLASFRALPQGLSVAEQMTALGCKSPQTIYALRAELRNYDPVLGGEYDL